MTIVGTIILALIVGLTEVLPVSGTGHFYILDRLFGVSLNQAERLSLQGVIYLGTAFALLMYYRAEVGEIARDLGVLTGIRRPSRDDPSNGFPLRLLLLLILSAIPLLAGLFLLPTVRRVEEGEFSLLWIAAALTFSGLLLYFSARSARQVRGLQDMTLGSCLLIGLAQIPAVFPGFSRTAFTLSAALLLGFSGESAFRYAGLLGIPTFLSAGLLNLRQAGDSGSVSTPSLLSLSVFFLAALMGIAALSWFSGSLKEKRPTGFAFWCWGSAILSLVLFLISA